jgi:hypothetical protein
LGPVDFSPDGRRVAPVPVVTSYLESLLACAVVFSGVGFFFFYSIPVALFEPSPNTAFFGEYTVCPVSTIAGQKF